MPPVQLIVDALLWAVLPAFLMAVVPSYLGARLGGDRFADVGVCTGLVAAVALGGFLRETLTLTSGGSDWNYIPWLGTGLVICVLGLRWLAIPWLASAGVQLTCILGAAWLFLPGAAPDLDWRVLVAFTALVGGASLVLQRIAAQHRDGGAASMLALAALAAAGVLIHAGSARLTDAATVLGAAFLGISFVAWQRRVDVGAIMTAANFYLAGILLMGQRETYSEVPWSAFLLPAAASLSLVVTLPLHAWPPLRLAAVRFALVLAPLVAALILARSAGPIHFE